MVEGRERDIIRARVPPDFIPEHARSNPSDLRNRTRPVSRGHDGGFALSSKILFGDDRGDTSMDFEAPLPTPPLNQVWLKGGKGTSLAFVFLRISSRSYARSNPSDLRNRTRPVSRAHDGGLPLSSKILLGGRPNSH